MNDAYALYESADGGGSWSRADVSGGVAIGDDWVNISFDAQDRAVITADRNIYRYDSKRKAWQSKEGNLQITLFYDVALAPSDPNIIYGVARDHPSVMRFNGSIEWAYVGAGSEEGKAIVDPSDTSRVYVYNPLTPGAFVQRSTDGGVTWTTILTTNAFPQTMITWAARHRNRS